jgi:hypothetical protein
MEQPIQTKEDKKRLYMREYMKKYKAKKYAEDAESIRRANRTRYLKKTHPTLVADPDDNKYGNHLADVIALRELINRIPPHFIIEVVNI